MLSITQEIDGARDFRHIQFSAQIVQSALSKTAAAVFTTGPWRIHNYAAIGIWNSPRQWCRQA
jgi:hypothetical protein